MTKTSNNTNSPVPIEWTLEIVPSQASNSVSFSGLTKEVFITMIPGAHPHEIIKTIPTIQAQGFEPVPHIATRNFPDRNTLTEFCEGLKRNRVRKALIIAGGDEKSLGPFPSSLSVLKDDAFHRSGITKIALAGHPEGNPADPNSMTSLFRKCDYIQNRGWELEIVTQWSFSPTKTNNYIKEIKRSGINCPIRIGVAAATSLKTLLKYAKICGVKVRAQVLKKQAFSLARLLLPNDPRHFIEKIPNAQYIHIYPFGGLDPCAKWLVKYLQELKAKSG